MRATFSGPLQGGIKVGHVDHEKAAKCLFGFREWAVLHLYRTARRAQSRRSFNALPPVGINEKTSLLQRAYVGTVDLFLGGPIFGRHVGKIGKVGVTQKSVTHDTGSLCRSAEV